MKIVHSDMPSPLLEQRVLLLPSLFGRVAQLVHVKFESLFQYLFQVSSSDPAVSRASFAIVSSRRKIISSYGIGLGALVCGASGEARAQTLHFGREARFTGLRELGLKCA